jgi:hypothetical protein
MAGFALNPPNAPIVNGSGMVTPEFYRWLVKVQGVIGEDVVAQIQQAPMLTYSPSVALPNDKVLTQGAGLSFTSGASTFTIALAASGVTASTYGSASQVSQITVDQYGRATLIANVTITPAAIGAAASSLTLTAGAGLAGGGDLSANRTFDVGAGAGITINANDVALDTANTRNVDHSAVSITSGAGLTGGGDISSTRTLAVGAGTGITVNADDVAIDGTVVTLTGTQTLTNKTLSAPLANGLRAAARTSAATTSATAADYLILGDASGGAITINLPAVASNVGMILVVKKIDGTGNAVTLDGNGAEAIDGVGTLAITTVNQAVTIQSNGSAWYITSVS